MFGPRVEGGGRGPRPAPAGGLAVASGLVVLLAALALFAGPVTAYTDVAAAQLMDPAGYIRAVLGADAVAALPQPQPPPPAAR